MRYGRGAATARGSTLALVGTLMLALAGAVCAGAPGDRAGASQRSLEIAFEPFTDQYFLLRKLAGGAGGVPRGWEAPVKALRQALALLPSARYVGLLDAIVASQRSLAELQVAAGSAPETGPGGVPLRAALLQVATALTLSAPVYGAVAAEHRHMVEKAIEERIRPQLMPKLKPLLDFLCGGLELQPPPAPVLVKLVARGPAPGGFTVRGSDGRPLCIVVVEVHAGSALLEAVIHEEIHALDAGSPGVASVLARLREALVAAGVGPDQPLHRNLPHTLIFVHAAQAVKRLIAPGHVDYGEQGYYAHFPDLAAAVRKLWTGHLDGVLTEQQVIEQLVARSAAGNP